jgi:iron complex transport system substrate-binding protein
MRICSFIPSATEIVYLLGLQDQLHGVTHECDYPPDAKNKPHVVRSVFEDWDHEPTSGEISETIGRRLQEGLGIYEIDLETLQAAEPDLLLTQAICEVCAVSSRQVAECSLGLSKQPQVISLDPQYIGDVLDDIRRVAKATNTHDRGDQVVASLQARIDKVVKEAAQTTERPRVLHLEWSDPLMCGGHWVPEMVEMAGGINCFGDKETGSYRLDWDDVVGSQPDVVVLMLCGYNVKRGLQDLPILQARPGWGDLPAVKNQKVFVMDGSAYTSRSGPRLVTGLEILAEILHPEQFSGYIPPNGAAKLYGEVVKVDYLQSKA